MKSNGYEAVRQNVLGLKVALFTDSDVFAGTERHILDLAVALKRQGREVMVACPALGVLAQRAGEEGIQVMAVEKGGPMDVLAIWRLAKALRVSAVDRVHAHNGRTTLIAVLARLLAGRGEVVVTQHFIEPSRTSAKGLKKHLKHLLHRLLNRRVAKIIAISEAVAEGIRRRGEARAKQVAKVWNGIRDPAAAARHHPLGGGAPGRSSGAGLLLCAARLEPEKGHDVLMDALQRLKGRQAAWQCLLAGDGGQRTKLERQVRESGLEDRVVFLGFRDDVSDLMANADVLVLTAAAEPFGLVLLEAMALGKPVVAMAAGGPLEIVEHDTTGFLTPPGDASALAQVLLDLLNDAELRETMGRKGRERYLAHFTAERMARETWQVYEEAVPA